MTLVLAVTSPKSIWMMTDKRLSYADPTMNRDDAHKTMVLETPDGAALLGYAGLGATRNGMEPSEWMVNVLRGRNLSMEDSLKTLGAAIRQEFPPHVGSKWIPGHYVVTAGFVNGSPQVYTMGIEGTPEGGYRFQMARQVVMHSGREYSVRTVVSGSGASVLAKRPKGAWYRNILRAVNQFNAGTIKAETAAKAFAQVNLSVSQQVSSVGPACEVHWRLPPGGGAGQVFDGIEPRRESVKDMAELATKIPETMIPTSAQGTDLKAFLKVVLPDLMQRLKTVKAGVPYKTDEEAINRELAKLKTDPDDKLR